MGFSVFYPLHSNGKRVPRPREKMTKKHEKTEDDRYIHYLDCSYDVTSENLEGKIQI